MKRNLFTLPDMKVMINLDNVEHATSQIGADNLVMVYFVSGASMQLKGFDARQFNAAWRDLYDAQQAGKD